MDMFGLVAALVVAVVAAVFAFWVVRAVDRRRANAWRQACQRLGPPFSGGCDDASFDVTLDGGQLQGADISRHAYSTSSPELHPYQAGYVVRGTPSVRLPPHFVAALDGLAVGGPRVLLDDPTIDEELVVGGSDPEAVRQFLDPARRVALRAFFAAVPHARICSDEIVISEDGRPDARRLYHEIDAVRKLMAALREAVCSESS